ncbi:hypothetical protein ACPPVU_21385 [Mucilaginibacter sp. McL0603]|uniref:hypothetical protein n=1 Tax=Mucilaginibacter sp. McL0603 TaxID=3415670 RepID=UPI003CF19D5A
MKGSIYIDENIIGGADFQIIDESMGVIGGVLIPNASYMKYENLIQGHYQQKGVANSEDFNFKIVLNDAILEPEGGISITDSDEFDEVYVEAAGLSLEILNNLK